MIEKIKDLKWVFVGLIGMVMVLGVAFLLLYMFTTMDFLDEVYTFPMLALFFVGIFLLLFGFFKDTKEYNVK